LCSPPLATPAYDGYLALSQLVDVLPLLVIVAIFGVGTLIRAGAARRSGPAANPQAE
jgi:hypothetical protein